MELLQPHPEPEHPLAPALPASSAGVAHTDAYSYLAQLKFHRRFVCPRTRSRVTYADIGDPDGTPVLYFLPSGCSRWIALVLEDTAQEKKVRVIAMDRPGSGGTEMCPLNERVTVACDMTESLLEHLGIQHATMLAASGGLIHLLTFIQTHPERLSTTHPTVLLASPWAPGNIWLPLIPAPLLRNEHKVIPIFFPIIKELANTAVTMSEHASRLVPSWHVRSRCRRLASALSLQRKRNPQAHEPSSPMTPSSTEKKPVSIHHTVESPSSTSGAMLAHTSPSSSSSSSTEDSDDDRIMFAHPYSQAWGLQDKYMWIEDQRGIGQEHLLCLGKGVRGTGAGKIGSKAWYREAIASLGVVLANAHTGEGMQPPLQVYAWWGDGDGVVPRKSRAFLDGLIQSANGVQYHRVEIEDAGHDTVPQAMDGMGEALGIAQARGAAETGEV